MIYFCEVENLVQGLKFVPTFQFEKDVSYEEFLNRVHAEEVILRAKGLWDVPHPWLNMFIPSSRISDFNEGVFKGIILKQNISSGIYILYPMNRNKWDDRMSAVIADEDVFYTTGILQSTRVDNVGAIQAQNQEILQFCKDNGIEIREYLTGNKTNEGWVGATFWLQMATF
ncbi:putative cytokinin dehydrogenase [Lupinus albus]|uniref:Putative cytokinin dehydrogenase n=1 Tax=Lupinus albus TaxID=3870 RepID=A0A6A4NCW9_LUPAL|nr:putative cytokinin dehydrogenase [Lupinus albus]